MSDIEYQDLIARYLNIKPKDVSGVDAISSQYYRHILLKKIYAIFDFENLPDNWDYDYLLEHLFVDGMVGVTDTEIGIVALKCGFAGKLNIYDRMTDLLFANPVLGSFTRTIGENCMYLHINKDFRGVMQLVNKYSVMLGMCDASININLLNSRVAFIGEASTQSQANVLKKLYTQISKSEPCIVYKNSGIDKGMNWYWNNVKQCYIANDIMETKNKIMSEFLTEIGIASTNTEKRERLVSDEVNSREEEKESSIHIWYNNLQHDIEIINKLFDLNIRVKINRYGGEFNDVT